MPVESAAPPTSAMTPTITAPSSAAATGLGTRLPPEVMTMVVHQLALDPGRSANARTSGRDTLAKLMRTSRALHDVVGPILYSRIVITRNNADALFYGAVPRRVGAAKVRYTYASRAERAEELAAFESLNAALQQQKGDGDESDGTTDTYDAQSDTEDRYWMGKWRGGPDDGCDRYVLPSDYESLSETDDEVPPGRYRVLGGYKRRLKTGEVVKLSGRYTYASHELRDNPDTFYQEVTDDEDDSLHTGKGKVSAGVRRKKKKQARRLAEFLPKRRDTVVTASSSGRYGAYFPLQPGEQSPRKRRLLAHCRALHIVQIPNQNLLRDLHLAKGAKPFPNVKHVALSSRAVLAAMKLGDYATSKLIRPGNFGRRVRCAEEFIHNICGDGDKVTSTCIVCPARQAPTSSQMFRFVRWPKSEKMDAPALRKIMRGARGWHQELHTRLDDGFVFGGNVTYHGLDGIPTMWSKPFPNPDTSCRMRFFCEGEIRKENAANRPATRDSDRGIAGSLLNKLYWSRPRRLGAIATLEFVDLAGRDLCKIREIIERADEEDEQGDHQFPEDHERVTFASVEEAEPCETCGRKEVTEGTLAELIAATERMPLLV